MPGQPNKNRCAELLKDELSQLLAALQQGFAVLGNLGRAATPVARSQVALEHLQTVHAGEPSDAIADPARSRGERRGGKAGTLANSPI